MVKKLKAKKVATEPITVRTFECFEPFEVAAAVDRVRTDKRFSNGLLARTDEAKHRHALAGNRLLAILSRCEKHLATKKWPGLRRLQLKAVRPVCVLHVRGWPDRVELSAETMVECEAGYHASSEEAIGLAPLPPTPAEIARECKKAMARRPPIEVGPRSKYEPGIRAFYRSRGEVTNEVTFQTGIAE